MFTKEEMATMSPAELAVAQDMNATEESGGDLFGDGPTVDTENAAIEQQATELAAATQATEPPGDDEAETEPAATEAAATAEPEAVETATTEQPTTYQVQDTTKTTTDRQALMAKKSEIESKWSGGELSDEERSTQIAAIEEDIYSLLRQEAKADALNEINAQMKAQAEAQVISHYIAEGAKAGLDYKTPKLALQFDRAMSTLDADPEFARMPYDKKAAEAHRTVLALNGKLTAPSAPAPAPSAAAPAAPRPRPAAPPQTLREMPAAAVANVGSDPLVDALTTATGKAAESMWAKLTPAQERRLLGDE